ncbi:response regulator [Streptomyces sp. NEAU-W12]|uniref:response regulator n=1 Tax=Streptomyces sp. NEAU-W12 TaxID=2994668 RepID=UPI00224B0B80|nr:response regulator transcription factor [Streptomyces sp. NEAU-W12]MCX2928042.1 response regulator transcription factor [Streptomyces sp. NEAU-W12]MCX2928244.1 response regulator transcription factor [Streptomyces sp. NEAU-W12]
MSIRLLVVDDQAIVRAGFVAILGAEDDMVVVGEAAEGDTAVSMAAELAPDLVLMDIRMPGMDGLTATRLITRHSGGTRVLVLTTFDLDAYVYEALRAGASGFLLKDSEPDDLLSAIRIVASGDGVLAPAVTRRLIAAFAHGAPVHANVAEVLDRLTHREREILVLVATGLSNAEIGARLELTVGTVKVHVSAVLSKLALRDRVQATIFAYESGLIRPSGTQAD